MSFTDRSNKHPLYTTALSLFILFCAGYLLILGQGLLIPFVVALFLWYLVNVLAGLFGKLHIAGVRPPGWARYLAAGAVLAVAIHIVIGIITSSVGELIRAATFSNFVANFDLITIFLLFLFIKQRYFTARINTLMPDPNRRAKLYFATAVSSFFVMNHEIRHRA